MQNRMIKWASDKYSEPNQEANKTHMGACTSNYLQSLYFGRTSLNLLSRNSHNVCLLS